MKKKAHFFSSVARKPLADGKEPLNCFPGLTFTNLYSPPPRLRSSKSMEVEASSCSAKSNGFKWWESFLVNKRLSWYYFTSRELRDLLIFNFQYQWPFCWWIWHDSLPHRLSVWLHSLHLLFSWLSTTWMKPGFVFQWWLLWQGAARNINSSTH